MSMFGGRISRLLANRNRSNLYRFRLHRNNKIESTLNTQPSCFSTQSQLPTANSQQSTVNCQQSTVNCQQFRRSATGIDIIHSLKLVQFLLQVAQLRVYW